jgi:hypothetical protein
VSIGPLAKHTDPVQCSHDTRPASKKQMLSFLPIDLIKVVKITSIEDGLKLSGGVEEGSGTSWRSGRPGTYQVRVLAPTA